MIVSKLEDIKLLIEQAIVDGKKAEAGNKSAAIRVRGFMTAVTKSSKAVRVEALALRNNAKAS